MADANTRSSFAVSAGLAAALFMGSAFAQGTGFSDESLQSFAVAAVQVMEINASAQRSMIGAESADEQQQVQAEASEQMVLAIESQGLTVEQYNEIATAAQADPEVANQIQRYIGETQ